MSADVPAKGRDATEERSAARGRALPSPETLADAVLARERGALARAITFAESSRETHRALAQDVLQRLLPRTGKAIRVGVSGVPGVGKSTFIEAFGMRLIDSGHRVAVLAVDPSSRLGGGSILGDKTRMGRLALADEAYIRPSPTGGHLGGVARKTREAMLLCEAAGFDVVLVETVGVGQSETLVAGMVDCLLLLLLPGAGDELQGIKKGVLELADIVAVNKADGATRQAALEARAACERALAILRRDDGWKPPVLAVSAATGDGLDALWEMLRRHRREAIESGAHLARRERQRLEWLWSEVEQRLLEGLREGEGMRAAIEQSERGVRDRELTVARAAERIVAAWRERG